MSMSKFRAGDRVRLVGEHLYGGSWTAAGTIGIIRGINGGMIYVFTKDDNGENVLGYYAHQLEPLLISNYSKGG